MSVFAGTLFGGSTNNKFAEALKNRSDTTYGFGISGMGNGIFGGDFDLGYTPKAFGENGAVESSNLMTVHGSLMLGVPIGGQQGPGIRPYGVTGLGLIRRTATLSEAFDVGDFSTTDFGYNVGVGVVGFVSDVFGLRAEYRYFRNFQKDDGGTLPIEEGTFHFSRTTFGVVFRF